MTDTPINDDILRQLGDALLDLPAHKQKEAKALLMQKLIEKAREDFYTFVLLMAPFCLPEEFKSGRHIQLICTELQKIEEYVALTRKTGTYTIKGNTGKLQIFLPPGSMKSILASRLFAAWCLGRHPKWRILAIGHSKDFAIDNVGRPVRDLIASAEYQEIFSGISLNEDINSAGRWETLQGGQFYAAGAGTRIAGRRSHIALVDDVISEQEADSKQKRAIINRWYGKGMQSRLLPGAAEIIINTRWHVEDLSGFTIKKAKGTRRPYRVVSIPALVDEAARKLLRREGDPPELYAIGTSYWPEFWPTQELIDKRDGGTLLPSDWAALYMQNPVPDEGNIIKAADIQQWEQENPPECNYLILSLDTAFSTKETADFSAYTLWGIFHKKETLGSGAEVNVPNMILIARGRGRWEFPELCQTVTRLYKKYRPDSIVIEKKASGQSLLQEFRRRGYPVVEYITDKDKMSRLHACTPFFQNKRIWMPQKAWVADVIDELVSFPHAPHDDYVDTVTQSILWMRDHWQLHHQGYRSFMEADEDNQPVKKKRASYWTASASTLR